MRQVSGGVDQDLYRYPLEVVAGIPPFNFPHSIAFSGEVLSLS